MAFLLHKHISLKLPEGGTCSLIPFTFCSVASNAPECHYLFLTSFNSFTDTFAVAPANPSWRPVIFHKYSIAFSNGVYLIELSLTNMQIEYFTQLFDLNSSLGGQLHSVSKVIAIFFGLAFSVALLVGSPPQTSIPRY